MTLKAEFSSTANKTRFLSPGLHLSDDQSLRHDVFDLVNHEQAPQSKRAAASRKNMKMGCFEAVPARLVLYFLSWSGFLVSFMMRNDINFALVVMVKTNNQTASNATASNGTEPQLYVNCVHFACQLRHN